MNYKMISADDHLDLQYLPTNLWTERLPKVRRDRAPHIEEREGGAVWVCDGEVWGRWAGTRRPTGPKALFNAFDRGQGVLDHVVQQPGRNRHGVELHIGQEVGDGKGVDQVGFARMADLSPMLERGEDVRAPEQLDVGVRAVRPDLFEQILESNHGNRCLTTCRMGLYSIIGTP